MRKEIKDIKNILVKNYKPEKIIIFGSYANGKENINSDIDILIVKNTKKSFYKRSAEVRNLLKDFNFPLDIIIYTPEEIDKWINIKQSFISKIFNSGELIYG
jgi:predicted nucleotidyltransferase